MPIAYQEIDGVPIWRSDDLNWYCDYEDYERIKTHKSSQNSKKSYFKWCKRHKVIPVWLTIKI